MPPNPPVELCSPACGVSFVELFVVQAVFAEKSGSVDCPELNVSGLDVFRMGACRSNSGLPVGVKGFRLRNEDCP